jgi:RND family efflux transporter MFP subunit
MKRMTLCAIVLLTTSGCEQPSDKSEDAAVQAAEPAQKSRTNVEVLRLTPRGFTHSVEYAGETRARITAVASAESSGRLLEVTREENEPIAAGDVVAKLDTRLASSQIDVARAQLKNAETELQRLLPLAADQLVPPSDVERAEGAVRSAKANVAAAQTQRSLSQVFAPIGGVVVERHLEPGEVAMPGSPILTIADLADMRVDIRVPEDEVRFLTEGAQVDIQIPALGPEGKISARVHRIGLLANTKNRTFPVELAIQNADLRIRSGLLVLAAVKQVDLPSAIVIPRDAVVDGPEGASVMVVESGKCAQRKVTLGPGDEQVVVVESGLGPGDALIVVGQRIARPGDEVVIIEPEASAARPDAASAGGDRAGTPPPPIAPAAGEAGGAP